MNESHIRNVIEAALLAAGKPLQPAELVELFDEGSRPQLQDIQAALTALMAEYSNRGIEIKEIAAGFRIQVRRELANEISRLWPERPARYSRAYLETLALIAYRQPITRAEIEAVRGVAVNPNILKTVIERNWVRVVGHRDVPGRPELLGTTRDFLDYFGLKSLDELPPLAELKAIGDIKVQFDLPDPGPIPLASEADGTAAVPEGTDAAGAPPAAAVDSAAQEGDPARDANAAREATAENTSAADTTTLGTTIADGTIASGEIAESPAEHEASVANTATADIGVAEIAATAADEAGAVVATGKDVAVEEVTSSAADGATDTAPLDDEAAKPAGSGGPVRKKRRGKARASDTALHEAEEFAASVDADLAAGDDDVSDEEELSAAGPDSSELVAGPRDIDD